MKHTVTLQTRTVECWVVEAENAEQAASKARERSESAAFNDPRRDETDFPNGKRLFAEQDEGETEILEVIEGEEHPADPGPFDTF